MTQDTHYTMLSQSIVIQMQALLRLKPDLNRGTLARYAQNYPRSVCATYVQNSQYSTIAPEVEVHSITRLCQCRHGSTKLLCRDDVSMRKRLLMCNP